MKDKAKIYTEAYQNKLFSSHAMNFISKFMAWLENSVFCLPKRLEKGHFSEVLAGVSTLT